MEDLPSSISPCSNVRRSCKSIMQDICFDNVCFGEAKGEEAFKDDGRRSVFINHSALDMLGTKITGSILEQEQIETSKTCENSLFEEREENSVLECINNLKFASWDEDNWHYSAVNYAREHMKRSNTFKRQKFERIALYIMVMDCINFCFWPTNDYIATPNKNMLEYEHLAYALKMIAENDDVFVDNNPNANNVDAEESHVNHLLTKAEDSYALAPQNLIKLTAESFTKMLTRHLPQVQTDEGNINDVCVIPNSEERVRLLIEMSQTLLTFHQGSATSFISKANQSSDRLVQLILQSFPGFRDATIAPKGGRWVAFYKRAQILVADLWAALGDEDVKRLKYGSDLCNFYDMDKITTFADYRVPQLLRHLNILKYSPRLAAIVDNGVEICPFSMDEIYIRAATVVAVDDLVTQVKFNIESKSDLEKRINAVKMDWYLWNIGEKLDRKGSLGKHHLVRTIFY